MCIALCNNGFCNLVSLLKLTFLSPVSQEEGSGLDGSGEGSGEAELESHRRLRNITAFPACVSDSDCQNDFKCFQYMCYPWNQKKQQGPFRSCKRR